MPVAVSSGLGRHRQLVGLCGCSINTHLICGRSHENQAGHALRGESTDCRDTQPAESLSLISKAATSHLDQVGTYLLEHEAAPKARLEGRRRQESVETRRSGSSTEGTIICEVWRICRKDDALYAVK